jgi:hypothetical protein
MNARSRALRNRDDGFQNEHQSTSSRQNFSPTFAEADACGARLLAPATQVAIAPARSTSRLTTHPQVTSGDSMPSRWTRPESRACCVLSPTLEDLAPPSMMRRTFASPWPVHKRRRTVARDAAAILGAVHQQLPAEFPAHVYESVVSGIRDAARAVLDAE